jgi:thioredoxin reductase (NADPH)
MEEANFLSRYASRVYLIHRRDEFRASKIMIDRARANEKVEFVTPHVVDEILAPQGLVTGIKLRNMANGEHREIPLDGVFVAIGHDPNSIVFRGKLDMDENGYLIAHGGTLTKVPGVFIAGDVQDHRYRQAVTAAGSGCMAALDAERFLENGAHQSPMPKELQEKPGY